jgi:hypothetical protein
MGGGGVCVAVYLGLNSISEVNDEGVVARRKDFFLRVQVGFVALG